MHSGFISLKRIEHVADFTICVDMDLLVLVEKIEPDADRLWFRYRVHLLSLSGSSVEPEPHPLAHSPTFQYCGATNVWNYELELKLYGDHVGLLLGQTRTASGDRLIVWNWKTGHMAVKLAEDEGLESFVFLQEGLIFMPSFLTNSLDVYAYEVAKDGGSFQPILAFFLPCPNSGLNYAFIQLRSQPASSQAAQWRPTDNPPSTSRPLGVSNIPFIPSIDDSIIVCSTNILPYAGEIGEQWRNRDLPDAEGTLIIKRSTIFNWLDFWKQKNPDIKPVPALHTGEEASKVDPTEAVEPPRVAPQTPSTSNSLLMAVRWNEWMYETRWIRGHDLPIWVRDVSGMRFALRLRAPESSMPPENLVQNSNETNGSSIEGNPPPGPTPVIDLSTPPASRDESQSADVQVGDQASSQIHSSATSMEYRTRICDFNLRPSFLQIFQEIPYPGASDAELSVDYSQLAEGFGCTEDPKNVKEHLERKTVCPREKQAIGRTTMYNNGWTALDEELGTEWTRRPVWDDTIIEPGTTYSEAICTSLPYLEITSRITNGCMSLMMDAERIIETKTDADGELLTVDILLI